MSRSFLEGINSLLPELLSPKMFLEYPSELLVVLEKKFRFLWLFPFLQPNAQTRLFGLLEFLGLLIEAFWRTRSWLNPSEGLVRSSPRILSRFPSSLPASLLSLRRARPVTFPAFRNPEANPKWWSPGKNMGIRDIKKTLKPEFNKERNLFM